MKNLIIAQQNYKPYMADFAGIELTPLQIIRYVQYRQGILEFEPDSSSLDQWRYILNPEHKPALLINYH